MKKSLTSVLILVFVLLQNPAPAFSGEERLSEAELYFVKYCEAKDPSELKISLSRSNQNNSNDFLKIVELMKDSEKKRIICTCFVEGQKFAFGEKFLESVYQYSKGSISKSELDESTPKNMEKAVKELEYYSLQCIDRLKIL